MRPQHRITCEVEPKRQARPGYCKGLDALLYLILWARLLAHVATRNERQMDKAGLKYTSSAVSSDDLYLVVHKLNGPMGLIVVNMDQSQLI